MKKALAICLALVMVMTLTVTAFAAPGAFVQSPSRNGAPELIEQKIGDSSCTAKLIITPYSERKTLDKDNKTTFEDAYKDIVGTSDLTTLDPKLSDLAKQKDILSTDLAVSDLFFIHQEGCEDHREHGAFEITLKPETLANFVGLMRLKDGKWELLTDARVEGDPLIFTSDVPAPFAIIVNKNPDGIHEPATGEQFPWHYVVIMVVAAAALVVLLVGFKGKKEG